MGAVTLLTGLANRIAPVYRWARSRPALAAVVLFAAVYALYLPFSGYDRLYYDANWYWEFARMYGKTGRFELLSFATTMRGYLLPLLLAPFAIAGPHIGLEPIILMRPLGAFTAALLFGALGPALWRAAHGPGAPVVSLVRRLVFGALGFALWRDYFNFPLSDFPAVVALATGLWALLGGPKWWHGALAGLAVGASVNMRPVFVLALPFAGLLALLPPPIAHNTAAAPPARARWARLGAMALTLALVLAPQWYINVRNFGEASPLVLAHDKHYPKGLYIRQLQWGLQYQKFETNAGKDYPAAPMFFLDPRGAALFATTKLGRFEDASQYWALARRHPTEVARTWVRHTFNGLDLQYPTPYVKQVYASSVLLAWLNYTVLLGGTVVLGHRARRAAWVTPAGARAGLLLAALLVPCLAALPTAIECRFLLPLHLLLSAAAAFGAHPRRTWRAATRRRRAGWAVGYVAVLGAAFAASASTQQQLEKGPRALLGAQAPVVNR